VPEASNKTLHVLGGGAWQVPTILLAKRLGYRVFVTDMYENPPGYAFADDHAVVNVRDREGTLAAARSRAIDGIICDTTDVGVPTAAYVAETLGLPGIGLDVAMRFTDKYLMREATSARGILGPRYVFVTDPSDLARAESIGFPSIVKPADSQSSRGVRRVDSRADLPAALENALANSAAGRALVEEFIDGTEVTVEGMCRDGVVHVLGISDKGHYADNPQVASHLAYPPGMSDDVIERIRAANAQVVGALGLRTGVTHAEFIVTAEGRIYLVEIAARGGGSRVYTHIAPYLSGVPIPELYIRYCMGDDVAWPIPVPGRRAALLEFFEIPVGVVRSIEGVEAAAKLPGVADLALELTVGQRFGGADNDRARPGYVVAFGETRDEVRAIAARARATIRVEVEPET